MPIRKQATTERLDTVLRVMRRCAAEADPDRVLQVLLEEAVGLLGGDDGGIAQWDEARAVLFQVRSYLPSTSTGVPLDMERSASGQAALTRKPVIVNDYQRRVGQVTPAGKIGARAGLAVPLLHEGRLLGTLSVHTFQEGRRFGPDDAAALELLAGIGASVLVGLERARLEGTLRVRQELLAAVSHDLKNPLTAAIGQFQLLERRLSRMETPEADTMRAGLERIGGTLQRVASIADQLADIAALESGRPLELDRRPTDLVALARGAIAEHEASMRHHTAHLESAEPAVVGNWDGPRLSRVLDNLVSNAVKYSPRGGEIVVTVAHEGDEAVLRVRDQGIGIPAEDLSHVFDRFYRAANVAGRFAGTGIGLAGARQVVEQHGGSIEVESREGIGSTFTVRLPLS